MSQRPAERKHIQTRRRRRIVLLLPSNPLGLHPEAMFIFRPCPDHQPQNHTLNVCDNWIPGCGSHSLHKCMRARLPPLRWHCHTFMRAHTPLSIHANTHFLQFFLKETKKKNPLDYSGTMGESRSPRQQAERDWSRVCM